MAHTLQITFAKSYGKDSTELRVRPVSLKTGIMMGMARDSIIL